MKPSQTAKLNIICICEGCSKPAVEGLLSCKKHRLPEPERPAPKRKMSFVELANTLAIKNASTNFERAWFKLGFIEGYRLGRRSK